jgi:hypothetical protein
VYRDTISVREYVAHGVDEASALDNAGVHTVVLRDGRVHDSLRTTPPSPPGHPCEGHYSVRGITFTFAWDPGTPAGGNFTARWSLRDGELRLTRISGRDAVPRAVGLKPFRRSAEMRSHRRTTAAAALAAAALVAACGGSAAPDKSGDPTSSVTLRLATQDRAPFPSARVLTRLAADVRRRSHRLLRVAITYQAAGFGKRTFDRAAARLVRNASFRSRLSGCGRPRRGSCRRSLRTNSGVHVETAALSRKRHCEPARQLRLDATHTARHWWRGTSRDMDWRHAPM